LFADLNLGPIFDWWISAVNGVKDILFGLVLLTFIETDENLAPRSDRNADFSPLVVWDKWEW